MLTAAKAELDAHLFGEEVVRVEVHVLPPQVLGDEPAEQRSRQGDTWVGVAERLRVRGGVAEQVELQVHRADEIEIHLDIKDAARDDGAWVVDRAEEEVAEKAGGLPWTLDDDPCAECQADDEGTQAGSSAVLIEIPPWQDAGPAETSPGQDGCDDDRYAIP